MARCKDYPCCGHTDLDPCEPQWYDAPGAFDTSRPGNKHALCEHESGICDVDEDTEEDDWALLSPAERAHLIRENSGSWLSHHK